MKVSEKDGCKVLMVSGAEVPYKGEVSLLAMKRAICAEVGEICETLEGGCLIIDEEGKIKDLPLNPKATKLYKYTFITDFGVFQMVDHIVGDVIYLPKAVKDRWDEEEQRLLALEDADINF